MINRKEKQNSGFTLIEMAVVLLISGVMFAALSKVYLQYQIKQEIVKTKEAMADSQSQIGFYFDALDVYPCPSDRSIPYGAPGFGRAFEPSCNPAAIGLLINTCTAGNGVCYVAGARDIDGNGTTNNEGVLIGGVPIFDIKDLLNSLVDTRIVFDSWGGALTYAVTEAFTPGIASEAFENGAIAALDEFGAPTAGINNDAHFALVSHGRDRKGSFLASGVQGAPCGPIIEAIDNENCDLDAVFVSALPRYEGQGTLGVGTYALSQALHDDYLFFTKSTVGGTWGYIPQSNDTHIVNLNDANIGIGTDSPTELLTVDGEISLNKNLLTEELCDDTGNDATCFPVELITGDDPAMSCPPGEVMIGIVNSEILCQEPVYTGLVARTCPDGLDEDGNVIRGWVSGFNFDGTINCTTD